MCVPRKGALTEVCATMNSTPLTAVSSNTDAPTVLTPATILTQKVSQSVPIFPPFEVKNKIKFPWRQVQFLAEQFWTRWKER